MQLIFWLSGKCGGGQVWRGGCKLQEIGGGQGRKRKVGFLTFCLWLYEINVEIINGTDNQEERMASWIWMREINRQKSGAVTRNFGLVARQWKDKKMIISKDQTKHLICTGNHCLWNLLEDRGLSGETINSRIHRKKSEIGKEDLEGTVKRRMEK